MQLILVGWKATRVLLVDAAKKITLIIKRGLCLLFLFFTTTVLATQEEGNNEYQMIFELGVAAMFEGDYETSSEIFEWLYAKTNSPRVKLEWARAAFLNKKYNVARKLFIEVLSSYQIPDSVRFNISIFLNEISRLGDYTDYSFSIVKDTNPFGSPEPQKIIIFGIPFDYTPPTQKETLNGLRMNFFHSKTLSNSGLWRVLMDLDGIKYEGKNKSKVKANLAVESKLKANDNISYRLGKEILRLNDKNVLEQDFLSINYRKDKISALFNKVEGEVKYSTNSFTYFPIANGSTNSINVAASTNLSDKAQLSLGIYLDKNFAKKDFLQYITNAYSVSLKVFTPIISSNTQLSFSESTRRFHGVDDLFLIKRKDNGKTLSVKIQPYSVRVYGLYPAIEISSESTKSNIPINSFRKKIFNFTLSKNY